MYMLYVHYGCVNRIGGAFLESALPNNLRKQRTKLGLTQKEAAAKLGIGSASYQRYESGTREHNLETLCKLADIFNTSTDYLLVRISKSIPTFSENSKDDKWAKLGTILSTSEKEKVIKALTD